MNVSSPPPDRKEANSPKEDLVVLLPEPDGKVGAIRVVNAGGSQLLDKPGQMVRVEDFHKPPVDSQPIAENEITTIFGAALSAQPDLTSRFAFFTLWFESDRTQLTAESRKRLPEILSLIKNRRSNEIHIVGHTDRVGSDLHNLKLSSKRANYVRDFFVAKGIRSNLLVVSFHGEAMPLIYTQDEIAEPLNRRVEILIR